MTKPLSCISIAQCPSGRPTSSCSVAQRASSCCISSRPETRGTAGVSQRATSRRPKIVSAASASSRLHGRNRRRLVMISSVPATTRTWALSHIDYSIRVTRLSETTDAEDALAGVCSRRKWTPLRSVMNNFGFVGQQGIPDLAECGVRRDGITQDTRGNLRDDSQGGRLNQFGELGSDEGRSEQCVGRGVNDQFRPSIEAIPVNGELRRFAGISGDSRSHDESFCPSLTFRASHLDYLRVCEDDAGKADEIASGQLVVPQF